MSDIPRDAEKPFDIPIGHPKEEIPYWDGTEGTIIMLVLSILFGIVIWTI